LAPAAFVQSLIFPTLPIVALLTSIVVLISLLKKKTSKQTTNHVMLDFYNMNVPEDITASELTTLVLSTMENAISSQGVNVEYKHAEVFAEGNKLSPPGFTSGVVFKSGHATAHCYSEIGLLAIDVFSLNTPTRQFDSQRAANEISKILTSKFPRTCVKKSGTPRFGIGAATNEEILSKDVSKDTVFSYRGYHVMLDFFGLNPQHNAIKDLFPQAANYISKALKQNQCRVVHANDIKTGNGSFTCLRLIDESHVTAHYDAETNVFAVDVFTCGGRPDITKAVGSDLHAMFTQEFSWASSVEHQAPRFKKF